MGLLRRLLGTLLTLVVLLAGLLYLLAWTEPGLQLLGRLAISGLGAGSGIESIHGRLGRTIEIRGLTLAVGEDRYEIAVLRLTWSPRRLLGERLWIDHLSAEGIRVDIGGESHFDPKTDDLPLAYLQLPFGIRLDDAEIHDIRLTGISDEPLQLQQLRLVANSDAERLHITSLQLVSGEFDATLSGTLGLQPGTDSKLELQWSHVPGSGTVPASSGRLIVRGRPRGYSAEAQARIEGGGIPAGEWTLSGTGDLRGLSVARLQGSLLDGTVEGSGHLAWSPEWRWEADLDTNGLDPGKQWHDWPGRLSARLHTSGETAGDTYRLALAVDQLTGTLRGYPVTGRADISRDGGILALRELRLASGKNILSASGTLAERWFVNTRLAAPDLAALLPGWSGTLEASAHISGAAARPRVEAQIDGKTLTGPGLSLQTLHGELALDARETASQSISARLEGIALGELRYERARLDFSGSWQQHRLSLAATGDEQQLDVAFSGGWQAPHWRGTLEQARWQMPHTGLWSLQQPVALTLGPRQVAVPDTCLSQDDAQLCIHADGNPHDLLVAGMRLEGFPLQVIEELLAAHIRFTSLMDARATATLKAGRLQDADLSVRLGAGGFSYDDPSLPAETYLDAGTLQARLDGRGLGAGLQLDLAGSDHLEASVELPGYRPQVADWRDQTLALKVTGELKELLLVKYLLEDIGSFRGKLNVALQGAGTLGRPRIAGGAQLADATLAIDRLGIELKRLNLDLQSRNDGLNITGSAESGKGSVELTGDIAFSDIASWEANVSLHGTGFEVMHIPEALIAVSPDLKARITPPEIRLSGELLVPRARLMPRDLDRQTGQSSDVVIMDSKAPAPSAEAWRVYSQVHLSLGDDVEIDGFGLKGDLLGAIDLTDRPDETTRARGTLSIEDGTYEAYGHKLDIVRGRLLFSGGPVDDPGLDFRAARTIRDVTAGINVGGTLKTPELSLYSDPPMSDSDIISYISFGRPLAQVGSGDGSAASTGLIAGGNLLGGLVGTAAGLEELGVEEGDTADEAAMVLGTYLTPQLYVRYRAGLYEAINEFHVIYEFTRNWGIRTISSVEKSSAELRFSFER